MMICAIRAASAGLAAALAVAAGPLAAQAWPAKPLRIVVPFPPGAATDLQGRFIAHKLTESLGQQVIVDNRPGANGTLGLALTAKSAPDGHTMALGQTGNLAISPSLTKVAYDPLRDFAPVSLTLSSPHVIAVHPSLPTRSVKELVALAREHPGQLNYASTGAGSAGHLGVELFKKQTRIDIIHVPYKGAVMGFTDLVAGHVAMMFTSVLSTASFARSGRVRMLGVASAQRSPSVPEIPTIAEAGFPGVEVTSWWGILVPAATPPEIVARLNAEIVKIMASQDARERIGDLGADLATSTPQRFADFIRTEHVKWGQLIKESGAKVD